MSARRIIGAVVAALGIAGIVAAPVWKNKEVPNLVRFPNDLDVTPRYEGTVRVYLDPRTNTPLNPPQDIPLKVTRHLQSLKAVSTKQLVVIKETLTLSAPPLFDNVVQEHQYVMDRRTMQNVDDPRAYAFTPANTVNRAGQYRLAFPFDTVATGYPVFKNEIGASYPVAPNGTATVEGLTVQKFKGQTEPQAMTPAYLIALDSIVKLPTDLTLDQAKPVLKASGVDIDALLPALLPKLKPEDLPVLLALSKTPVALSYVLGFTGEDSVEPKTGSILQVSNVVETVSAFAGKDSLPKLKAVLDHYPDVPEAVAASKALTALASRPIPVFENRFSQTAASVTDIAMTVKDQKNKRNLAEHTIPSALLVGGLALAIIGLVLVLIPKRMRPAAPASTSVEGIAEAGEDLVEDRR